jgi:hypothetical protein
VDGLLRSISWHAEKQFRRHGAFPSVFWLTEDPPGRRELWERWCEVPESVASDAQVLAALAEETREDCRTRGVLRFGVAYLGNRVAEIRPADRNAAMQPSTTKRRGVVIELHAADVHVQIFREIIRLPGRAPMLGTAATLDEPFTSPYAAVLQLAATLQPDQRQDAGAA